jgi:hypothetical protein
MRGYPPNRLARRLPRRQTDGEPRVSTLWFNFARIRDFVEGFELAPQLKNL